VIADGNVVAYIDSSLSDAGFAPGHNNHKVRRSTSIVELISTGMSRVRGRGHVSCLRTDNDSDLEDGVGHALTCFMIFYLRERGVGPR
jgi:hypothetical protein